MSKQITSKSNSANNHQSFGHILKELREKHNLTQSKLADLLGTTQQTIGRYERCEREAGHDMLIKVSDYFRVPVDYLLGTSTFNTENKLKMEEFFDVISTSTISDSIEENFSEPYKGVIYFLVQKNILNSFVGEPYTVDLLYMITEIYEYFSDLMEMKTDMANIEDFDKFTEFYKETLSKLANFTSLILDKDFSDITRKDIYFKEGLLKISEFINSRRPLEN